ncbi:hypothetical protein ACP26L_25690 [Paenibacillus sp. S-38]|uniref:hypothetical protein n=1 Tax=Paenibacillus sp. S-38 TaxID=3416710 RepID=UPI003CF98C97
MNHVKNFQIEDIDGCEFVKCSSVGNMMISFHRDEDGYETGHIRTVYPDGSHGWVTPEKAQSKLDSGEWKVYRIDKTSRQILRAAGFEEHVMDQWSDAECDEQLEAIQEYPEG